MIYLIVNIKSGFYFRVIWKRFVTVCHLTCVSFGSSTSLMYICPLKIIENMCTTIWIGKERETYGRLTVKHSTVTSNAWTVKCSLVHFSGNSCFVACSFLASHRAFIKTSDIRHKRIEKHNMKNERREPGIVFLNVWTRFDRSNSQLFYWLIDKYVTYRDRSKFLFKLCNFPKL